MPYHLTADTDFEPMGSVLLPAAWLGFVFVIAIILIAMWASRRKKWRPAAFGLWWFLFALVPTAIFPLAEVENDHRMFFPFVGLALAVCWFLGQTVRKLPARAWIRVTAAVAG